MSRAHHTLNSRSSCGLLSQSIHMTVPFYIIIVTSIATIQQDRKRCPVGIQNNNCNEPPYRPRKHKIRTNRKKSEKNCTRNGTTLWTQKKKTGTPSKQSRSCNQVKFQWRTTASNPSLKLQLPHLATLATNRGWLSCQAIIKKNVVGLDNERMQELSVRCNNFPFDTFRSMQQHAGSLIISSTKKGPAAAAAVTPMTPSTKNQQ